MPTTATLAIPFPSGADDADVPTHIENLAERVETLMLRSGEIATHAPVVGDAGKLVICQSDGHLAYKVISGDINIDQTGLATIPPGALTGVELQDNAVGSRAVDADAIGATELKDSADVAAYGPSVPGGNFGDLAGGAHALAEGTYLLLLAVAPTVALELGRVLTGKVITDGSGAATFLGGLQTSGSFPTNGLGANDPLVPWSTVITVTAATALKLQAKLSGSGGAPQVSGSILIYGMRP